MAGLLFNLMFWLLGIVVFKPKLLAYLHATATSYKTLYAIYCNLEALNQFKILFYSPKEYPHLPVIKKVKGRNINIVYIVSIANGSVNLIHKLTGFFSSQ